MRVIAGAARRLQLQTPKGDNTRPTTDRIKETLFNVLQEEIPGAVFVDLFAGSGGIGIEALSRGTSKAYFFDTDQESIRCIDANLKHTGLADRAVVVRQDAVSALQFGVRVAADVVFADPPYGQGLDRALLQRAAEAKSVTPQTLIVIEEQIGHDFSYVTDLGFSIVKVKNYKTNMHVFLRRGTPDNMM